MGPARCRPSTQPAQTELPQVSHRAHVNAGGCATSRYDLESTVGRRLHDDARPLSLESFRSSWHATPRNVVKAVVFRSTTSVAFKRLSATGARHVRSNHRTRRQPGRADGRNADPIRGCARFTAQFRQHIGACCLPENQNSGGLARRLRMASRPDQAPVLQQGLHGSNLRRIMQSEKNHASNRGPVRPCCAGPALPPSIRGVTFPPRQHLMCDRIGGGRVELT